MARQGRAVGSWRSALLQHHWGRDSQPRGTDMGSWALVRTGLEPWGVEIGSWALGRAGGPQGSWSRARQGWQCPQGPDNVVDQN